MKTKDELNAIQNELRGLFGNIEHKNPTWEYTFGPLNKSPETKILEEITRNIITCYGTNNSPIFSEINNEYYVNNNGTTYALAPLLREVNWSQLSFSDKEIELYATLIKQNNDPSFQELKNSIKSKQGDNLDDLNYGEMLAIRAYTTHNICKSMNGLLRNLPIQGNLSDTILNISIASHGLNKLPSTPLPNDKYFVRYQDNYKLEELISKSKHHSISEEQAFTSTSIAPQQDYANQSKVNVQIIYHNVFGKDISALSTNESELEFLLPPSTQLKWTGHQLSQDDQGKELHILTTEGVRNILIDKKYVINESMIPELIDIALKEDNKSAIINLLNIKSTNLDSTNLKNEAELLLDRAKKHGSIHVQEGIKNYIDENFQTLFHKTKNNKTGGLTESNRNADNSPSKKQKTHRKNWSKTESQNSQNKENNQHMR